MHKTEYELRISDWSSDVFSSVLLAHEATRVRQILGDDAVGMVRAVGFEVVDRLIKAIDDADRQDRRQILGTPILLGRRLDARQQLACACADAQFDACLAKDAR